MPILCEAPHVGYSQHLYIYKVTYVVVRQETTNQDPGNQRPKMIWNVQKNDGAICMQINYRVKYTDDVQRQSCDESKNSLLWPKMFSHWTHIKIHKPAELCVSTFFFSVYLFWEICQPEITSNNHCKVQLILL